MKPGIHERIYEFCFNTEFCQRFGALLATHPLIPSQRMEYDLGYDVEFQLGKGNYITSLFLQYKAAHFVQHKKGKNSNFYESHGGPYYRFPVSVHQHNTLRVLAHKNKRVYYCAPMFYTSNKLTEYATQKTIYDNSVLLPLRSMNSIKDGQHNITYNVDGRSATLHSEARQIEIIRLADNSDVRNWLAWGGEHHLIERQAEAALDEAYSLAEIVIHLAFSAQGSVLDQIKSDLKVVASLKKPIEKMQYILGHIYNVSWLLLKS